MAVYQHIETPFSDSYLKRHLKNPKILPYGELDKINSIEQLLPNELDYTIILLQRKKAEGHWITVARKGKHIMHYDSLGNRPDKYLKWAPKQLRKKLGQDEPHLSYLLNDAKDKGYHVTFNDKPHQEYAPHVQTCGWHAVYFVRYLHHSDKPTLKGYDRHLQDLKNTYNQSCDMIVCNIVK